MHDKFRKIKWFLFLDDDVHIRPFALISMLKALEENSKSPYFSATNMFADHGRTSRPFAMISASYFHGEAVKAKATDDAGRMRCKAMFFVDYCFAQPAILTR